MHMFTDEDDDEDAECLNNEEEWQDIEIEVALDSGSIVNVCHEDDAPGYELVESPGSKRNQHFIVGNGGRMPNQGEKHLNLEAPKGTGSSTSLITSKFQIAAVTRPLMSVGHICDQGMDVAFNKVFAIVTDANVKEVCRFTRVKGGLYVCKMKLKSPFGRQS